MRIWNAAVGMALAALLAGCGGAPGAEAPKSFGSVGELKSAYVDAGGACDTWLENNLVVAAAQSGECESGVLMTFLDEDAASAHAQSLKESLASAGVTAAFAVGGNWIVNTSDAETAAAGLGGTVVRSGTTQSSPAESDSSAAADNGGSTTASESVGPSESTAATATACDEVAGALRDRLKETGVVTELAVVKTILSNVELDASTGELRDARLKIIRRLPDAVAKLPLATGGSLAVSSLNGCEDRGLVDAYKVATSDLRLKIVSSLNTPYVGLSSWALAADPAILDDPSVARPSRKVLLSAVRSVLAEVSSSLSSLTPYGPGGEREL